MIIFNIHPDHLRYYAIDRTIYDLPLRRDAAQYAAQSVEYRDLFDIAGSVPFTTMDDSDGDWNFHIHLSDRYDNINELILFDSVTPYEQAKIVADRFQAMLLARADQYACKPVDTIY